MKRPACLFLSLLCLCLLNMPFSAYAKTEEEYQQEMRSLQKRNIQLENTLEQLTSDLKNTTNQVKLLQDQITKMADSGEDNAEEAKAARAALKDVKKQLKELLAQQSESNAGQQKQLETQLNKVLQEKQSLEKELKALKKKTSSGKSSASKKELDELQAELEKQKKQYKANLSLLDEREQELQEAQKKIRSLNRQEFPQKDNQQTETRTAELESALTTLNARLIKLSQENQNLKSQLSSSSPEFQQDDARLRELEKKLAGAKVTILDLDRQRADLESRLSAQQTQQQGVGTQKLEGELAEANAKVLELNRQKGELESALSARQTQQQDSGTQKDAEILRLEEELLKAADYINSTNPQLTDLTQKNADLSTQLRESQHTLATLQSQVAQSSDTAQNQSREVSALQEQLILLQSQLQDSDLDKKRLQNNVLDLEHQLTLQGSVPEEAKKRIQELTQELQDARIQVQQQQHVEREYPILQQQVRDLQMQVAAQKAAHDNAILFEARAEELQIAFDEARRETAVLMEQNRSLQEELSGKAETYQTQGRKFQEFSLRNQDLEQQYQQGLQELALKEKLLQQALLEKSVLEKALDDEGPRQSQQQLQQQLTELQTKLLAFQANELRDAEYSRLVTDLQEKLLKTETQNGLLQKEVLELQQSSLQSSEVPDPPTAKDSGQLAALHLHVSELETELAGSRKYAQNLQQQLAATDMASASSPGIAADSSLSRFFPAGLGSGGTVNVLGSSPDNTKLAYLESRDRQQRLFIFNTLSRKATQVTEWPGSATNDMRFAWAFDSEHFLFATGDPGNYLLYLGNSTHLLGQPIQLHENHIAFAWSPTQSQFAYFSGSSLIIQNLEQQTLPVQIGHQPGLQETSLAWSPDGRQIALCAKQGTNFDIFVLAFANNTPTLQILVASPSDDLLPSWSPDGRYLAFYVRADQYDTKVAVSPIDKSRAPYIVGHNASLPPDKGPRWLSGAELTYVGDEHLSATQNSVYVVNISTGQRSSVPLSLLLAR